MNFSIKRKHIICIFREVKQSCVLFYIEVLSFWTMLKDVSHLLSYLQ